MKAAIAIVLAAASVAVASPVVIDDDFVEAPMPQRKRSFSCPSNTSWEKLQRCLETHDKLSILYDFADAKLVRLHGRTTMSPTLFLYMRVDNQWIRTSFYGDLSPSGELLAFTSLRDHAYRIEMGTIYPSSFSLDGVSTVPAMLRNKITYMCTARGMCHAATTLCELSVHGKVYWSFRGKPVWDGTMLRVAGDPTNAGPQCAVPPSMLAPG